MDLSINDLTGITGKHDLVPPDDLYRGIQQPERGPGGRATHEFTTSPKVNYSKVG